jgi:hypothetical protein
MLVLSIHQPSRISGYLPSAKVEMPIPSEAFKVVSNRLLNSIYLLTYSRIECYGRNLGLYSPLNSRRAGICHSASCDRSLIRVAPNCVLRNVLSVKIRRVAHIQATLISSPSVPLGHSMAE